MYSRHTFARVVVNSEQIPSLSLPLVLLLAYATQQGGQFLAHLIHDPHVFMKEPYHLQKPVHRHPFIHGMHMCASWIPTRSPRRDSVYLARQIPIELCIRVAAQQDRRNDHVFTKDAPDRARQPVEPLIFRIADGSRLQFVQGHQRDPLACLWSMFRVRGRGGCRLESR